MDHCFEFRWLGQDSGLRSREVSVCTWCGLRSLVLLNVSTWYSLYMAIIDVASVLTFKPP
jgi:hypothetical protein